MGWEESRYITLLSVSSSASLLASRASWRRPVPPPVQPGDSTGEVPLVGRNGRPSANDVRHEKCCRNSKGLAIIVSSFLGLGVSLLN